MDSSYPPANGGVDGEAFRLAHGTELKAGFGTAYAEENAAAAASTRLGSLHAPGPGERGMTRSPLPSNSPYPGTSSPYYAGRQGPSPPPQADYAAHAARPTWQPGMEIAMPRQYAPSAAPPGSAGNPYAAAAYPPTAAALQHAQAYAQAGASQSPAWAGGPVGQYASSLQAQQAQYQAAQQQAAQQQAAQQQAAQQRGWGAQAARAYQVASAQPQVQQAYEAAPGWPGQRGAPQGYAVPTQASAPHKATGYGEGIPGTVPGGSYAYGGRAPSPSPQQGPFYQAPKRQALEAPFAAQVSAQQRAFNGAGGGPSTVYGHTAYAGQAVAPAASPGVHQPRAYSPLAHAYASPPRAGAGAYALAGAYAGRAPQAALAHARAGGFAGDSLRGGPAAALSQGAYAGPGAYAGARGGAQAGANMGYGARSLAEWQQGAAAAAAAAAQGQAMRDRANMRVQIDSRGRNAQYDLAFVAEDTTTKDHSDEVMQRCEEISRRLFEKLGRAGAAGDRFAATEGEGSYQQVDQAQLMEACGSTARYLKPYQLVGINFLLLLHRQKIGGAILADEMGLGKTAQLISYLGAVRSLDRDEGPHLVVVPASLLENWQRELRRWCPALRVVVYYGKHRSVRRAKLLGLRERAAAGEDVGAELAELEDPELVADAALAEKEAEARAAAREEEGGEEAPDPYGRDGTRDSDEDYEGEQDSDGSQGGGGGGPPLPPACTMDEVIPRAPFHVMLTCYTLFERDSPEQRADRAFLEKWRWSHLVMDEAHALKNRLAARTTRLRRVANATRRRIMMTGTPLQNDLAELQNLLHFLLPQVFAEQGIEDLAEMLADEGEIAKLTARMKALLGPFVLRRLKTEVAGQLTNKEHRVEFLPMAAEQAKLYQESVARYRAALPGRADKERDRERDKGGEKSDKQVEKFLRTLGAKRINHMFTHLRKIAQHPLLVRHRFDEARVDRVAALAHERALFSGNATPKRVREELLSYSDYSLHAFCYNAGPDFAEFLLSSEHLHSSSKFVFLAKLLPRLKAAGSRPLIFSQWTAVLDVMEWLMDELQLPYVRMDGSTAVEERLATVDRFNNCPEVFAFLLSTRAGGQGLNLVGADTVILHDVDFNPQIDRQAEDRCHRLGQTKPVTVYRLVTEGSVDQNIYDLSQRKLKLDAAVLDGITTTSTKVGETAAERQQMGFILHSLLTGAGGGQGGASGQAQASGGAALDASSTSLDASPSRGNGAAAAPAAAALASPPGTSLQPSPPGTSLQPSPSPQPSSCSPGAAAASDSGAPQDLPRA